MKKFFSSNKNLIIILIISILLVSFTSLYFVLYFSLHINGKEYVEIDYNTNYKDKGATYKLFGMDISNKIKVKNNVNTKKIGNYKVTYSIKYLLLNIKRTRIVIVKDKSAPKIKLNGEEKVLICPNSVYVDEGYEAKDTVDGNITKKVKVKQEEDKITYTVTDKAGNKSKKVRHIIKEDKEPPKLTLVGKDITAIALSYNYVDSGYDVTDNCDKEVKVTQEGNIDINKEGRYSISYIATDSSGNESKVTRTVVVQKQSGGTGIIYLTFDDGPSSTGSTEKILEVLRNNGIKATFFVTGNGPANLIKKEYDEGHVIALHTYTHSYASVYSSVDNYFNDLNKISDLVYSQTGQRSNIIRFPGGSNNTVSNRYSPGIMDILTKQVLDKGYIYFDWNITSGDAGECSTSSCVYNNVTNRLSKSRNNIVLMHDVKWFTANALDDIIKFAKNNGYSFGVISSAVTPARFK